MSSRPVQLCVLENGRSAPVSMCMATNSSAIPAEAKPWFNGPKRFVVKEYLRGKLPPPSTRLVKLRCSQPDRAHKFTGFAKYLLHGLAGTSAPKAAVLAPLQGGAQQPPAGARLVVLPPHDGRLLGSPQLELLVVVDGWAPAKTGAGGAGVTSASQGGDELDGLSLGGGDAGRSGAVGAGPGTVQGQGQGPEEDEEDEDGAGAAMKAFKPLFDSESNGAGALSAPAASSSSSSSAAASSAQYSFSGGSGAAARGAMGMGGQGQGGYQDEDEGSDMEEDDDEWALAGKEVQTSAMQPSSSLASSGLTHAPSAAVHGASLGLQASRAAASDVQAEVYQGPSSGLPERPRFKRKQLFSGEKPEVVERLKLDSLSLFSVTRSDLAERMTSEAVSLVGAGATVTDATACVGGNTISFGRRFAKVHAVEISRQRSELLQHNLRVTGVADRVTVHCGDGAVVPLQLQQDLVFFDPPWGGPEYLKVQALELYLGEQPLKGVVRTLCERGKCRWVLLKLPRNYDVQGLRGALAGVGEITKVEEVQRGKMLMASVRVTSAVVQEAGTGANGFAPRSPDEPPPGDSGVGGFAPRSPDEPPPGDSGVGGFAPRSPDEPPPGDSGVGGFAPRSPDEPPPGDNGVGGFAPRSPDEPPPGDSGVGGFAPRSPDEPPPGDNGVGGFAPRSPDEPPPGDDQDDDDDDMQVDEPAAKKRRTQ